MNNNAISILFIFNNFLKHLGYNSMRSEIIVDLIITGMKAKEFPKNPASPFNSAKAIFLIILN
tara:strand:+ start:16221 stop:16409 length:189 start_codon:yes stop_codon:yes gene_type:complete